jgi:hypothetical protein
MQASTTNTSKTLNALIVHINFPLSTTNVWQGEGAHPYLGRRSCDPGDGGRQAARGLQREALSALRQSYRRPLAGCYTPFLRWHRFLAAFCVSTLLRFQLIFSQCDRSTEAFQLIVCQYVRSIEQRCTEKTLNSLHSIKTCATSTQGEDMRTAHTKESQAHSKLVSPDLGRCTEREHFFNVTEHKKAKFPGWGSTLTQQNMQIAQESEISRSGEAPYAVKYADYDSDGHHPRDCREQERHPHRVLILRPILSLIKIFEYRTDTMY